MATVTRLRRKPTPDALVRRAQSARQADDRRAYEEFLKTFKKSVHATKAWRKANGWR